MKNLLTLASAAVIALAIAAPAHAASTSADTKTSIEKEDDGGYKAETTTKSEDAAGTTVKSDQKEEVDVDSNGDVEKTVTSKTSEDPKGLFNKKTTSTKDVVTKKGGKVTHKHKKKINGDVVIDTESTVQTK